MKIHFSIDDVIKSLKWLTMNQADSVFDSYIFGFAKQIFDKYHIPTSFYCMYSDGVFSLDEVSNKWKREFEHNSDWLKFGFHCYEGGSNYAEADEDIVKKEYFSVINEIERFAGKNVVDKNIRLHYFAGSFETMSFLARQGVRGFLCADDDRISYDLTEQENRNLKQRGWMLKEGRKYIVTNIRIENVANIDDELMKLNVLDNSTVEIFTHEKYLSDNEFRKKTIQVLEKVMEA